MEGNKKRDPITILVVGGHPADVFDHCGGTMAHHIERGDRVVCLALTQGLRVHDVVMSEKYRNGIPPEEQKEFERIAKERAAVKEQEVRDACACLGITDVRFLSYSEEVLLENIEMIKSVAAVIRDVKPNVIISHYPYEEGGVGNHHATSGKIVSQAWFLARSTDYENNIPAWRCAQQYYMINCYATQLRNHLGSMMMPFIPFYVDISDVVEKKVRAIACMGSQQYGGAYARKAIETCEGQFGLGMHTGYAEAFVPAWAECYDYLPVSQKRLDWANALEEEHRERESYMVAPYMDL